MNVHVYLLGIAVIVRRGMPFGRLSPVASRLFTSLDVSSVMLARTHMHDNAAIYETKPSRAPAAFSAVLQGNVNRPVSRSVLQSFRLEPLLKHTMAINHAVGVVLAFLLALVLFKYSPGRKLKSLPLPPGPKGLPFVGNISDLPPPGVPEFQHWLQHKENYGLLSSITVLGQTMIIIHDKEAAFELMEKRAHKHSGRPSMKFGMEM